MPPLLVSELPPEYHGRKTLILGGGPSAPAQVGKIRLTDDWLVISANAHGFKLLGDRVDLVWCKDNVHTETKHPMEPVVRAGGKPVMGLQYWADYRAPEWPIRGNSGQMAIGVPAMLKAPVIVLAGFDCYQGGTYFHSPKAANVSNGRSGAHWAGRFRNLSVTLQGANIRAFDPIPLRFFPKYNPRERFPDPRVPVSLQHYASYATFTVQVLRPFRSMHTTRTEVPAGTLLACHEAEAAMYIRLGVGRAVGKVPQVPASKDQSTIRRILRSRIAIGR